MIESVEFHNFKALRDTTLPLSRFTLIVGPNGSGKSTAMQALQAVGNPSQLNFHQLASVGLQVTDEAPVEVIVNWGEPFVGASNIARWLSKRKGVLDYETVQAGQGVSPLTEMLSAIRIYSFDARAMTTPVHILPTMELDQTGTNLAGVLDLLHSREPERFGALNEELGRWLPEFDRILLDTSGPGQKSILLRTREGHHKIQAIDLSQGTLLALALLTLAYLPDPPPIVCIEEPDRGIHPRLLRNAQDALYRLSYPESGGETRDPIQVIATTHSPYMLDLYSDHPEEIVIAQKVGQNVQFERLSDRPDIDELLEDARLGDIWYTGILGGVPSHP